MDFQTNSSLKGTQKNERNPIEQLLYGGRSNAAQPRKLDAAPMVDWPTTKSRTRRSEALIDLRLHPRPPTRAAYPWKGLPHRRYLERFSFAENSAKRRFQSGGRFEPTGA
jgi:hypothetical protein